MTPTYTHGLAPGDQKIQLARSVSIGLASGAYANPTGASREAIDDYSVQYEAMSSRIEASPHLVSLLRRQYGRPVGAARLVASHR